MRFATHVRHLASGKLPQSLVDENRIPCLWGLRKEIELWSGWRRDAFDIVYVCCTHRERGGGGGGRGEVKRERGVGGGGAGRGEREGRKKRRRISKNPMVVLSWTCRSQRMIDWRANKC